MNHHLRESLSALKEERKKKLVGNFLDLDYVVQSKHNVAKGSQQALVLHKALSLKGVFEPFDRGKERKLVRNFLNIDYVVLSKHNAMKGFRQALVLHMLEAVIATH